LGNRLDLRFIITGHGRSGTQWLARVMDQCDSTIAIHHEPLAQYDMRHYANVYAGIENVDQFIRRRVPKMHAIWERHPDLGYAEVNSYLRYCMPELRDTFNMSIIAIVRDGRYVVRSMLARGCYQKPGYPPIQPSIAMNAFDACCWYWADTYRRLTCRGVRIYRLEDLNADFDVFQTLCNTAGAQADKSVWQQHAGQRANVGVGDVPLVWSTEQKSAFQQLAGSVQQFFGYEGG